MALTEQEKAMVRKAVFEVVLDMAEGGQSMNPTMVWSKVMNYHPWNLRQKIGADQQRANDYEREIAAATNAAFEMATKHPENLRRIVTGEEKLREARPEPGFAAEPQHEPKAHEGAAPEGGGITQFGAGTSKMLVVEPLGAEPAIKHNMHPAIYDPREESVVRWLGENLPLPDANKAIDAYRETLRLNISGHFDPYRASWDALLRAVPPHLRSQIAPSIGPAKSMLKEKMLRDALLLGKIGIEDALRVIKPSMNLARDYRQKFEPNFRKLKFASETAAELATVAEILPHDEKAILAKLVSSDAKLKNLYETVIRPRIAKRPLGGGGGGGMTPKSRSDERSDRRMASEFARWVAEHPERRAQPRSDKRMPQIPKPRRK